MKKLVFILVILFIIPIVANAKITCNDGTASPTCETCHTGCCSGHDGCTESPHNNYNSNKKNDSISKNKYKKSKVNYTLAIIIGILAYVISIILLLTLDSKFNLEDKIVYFIEKHDLFTLLLYISFLGLVISLGWLSIPMYMVQNYTIFHEIGSIIILTFITYCFFVIEQN